MACASSLPPSHPSFWEAFRFWLKLGLISFGGPAGQIAIMHQELVERRRWISERRFLHALNYCMLLPGPEAQQMTIYLGWLLHRTWGGIVAGTLFVLPSFLLLVLLSAIYVVYGHLPLIQGIFEGIKPAVVAIVFFAVWRIGSRVLKNGVLWLLAALSFVAIFAFDVPFPLIVLGAALAGAIGGKFLPEAFRVGGGHATSSAGKEAALIDDDTPLAPHTHFRVRALTMLTLVFVAIWGAVFAWLPSGTLSEMAAFFTKAALVTFGGAYAVLPYVYQGGVETYGWLTGPQMIDGLALGETTPGPLIMVVAFVGFLGGWSHQVFGPEALLLGGIAGAAVATFFTFLPSFFFILAGAPLVESTRGNLTFTAPLTGITAAVVGVVLHLALFFAWHVLWPRASGDAPFAGGFDGVAALLALGAFVAMWRFRLGVLPVIGVCAAIGLLRSLIG